MSMVECAPVEAIHTNRPHRVRRLVGSLIIATASLGILAPDAGAAPDYSVNSCGLPTRDWNGDGRISQADRNADDRALTGVYYPTKEQCAAIGTTVQPTPTTIYIRREAPTAPSAAVSPQQHPTDAYVTKVPGKPGDPIETEGPYGKRLSFPVDECGAQVTDRNGDGHLSYDEKVRQETQLYGMPFPTDQDCANPTPRRPVDSPEEIAKNFGRGAAEFARAFRTLFGLAARTGAAVTGQG